MSYFTNSALSHKESHVVFHFFLVCVPLTMSSKEVKVMVISIFWFTNISVLVHYLYN